MTHRFIKFLARSYYRINQGQVLFGTAITALTQIILIYGVYGQRLGWEQFGIVPFAVVGVSIFVAGLFAGGFFLERAGFIQEMISHSNRELNPEWADAYAKIKEMHENQKVLQRKKIRRYP